MSDFNKAIERISPESLVKVVSFLGWKEIDVLFNGKVRQFVSPNDEYAALIPLRNEFSDYNRVLKDTLSEIASFEKRNIGALVNRILNPSFDILKWRIANEYTDAGRISLLKMTETIDNIKDILAVSCIDILNPSRYHAKVYTNDVNDSISKYEFGQTEFGSYILNILCPLGHYQYELFDSSTQEFPLSRKINTKLLHSINNIQEDLNLRNASKVEEELEQGMYSVNFLDSLTSIYESTKDAEINIVADWCQDVPLLMGDAPVSEVKLAPVWMDKVNYIAEKYRPRKEENIIKPVYGKIANVGSNPNVEDREYVEVSLSAIGDDNKKINIVSRLDYKTYFASIQEAFEQGSNVRLTGTYISSGRQKKIENGVFEKLD